MRASAGSGARAGSALALLVPLIAACATKPPGAAAPTPAGPSWTMPCEAGQAEPPLPFSRACSRDADCALVEQLVDCCGSARLRAVNAAEAARFGEAARACAPGGARCECLAQPTVTEGGKTVHELREAWASCLGGGCVALP